MIATLNEFERNMVEQIESRGWFALSVAPATESDDPEERFTYTVGLPYKLGWPEIVCFGLSKDTAYGLLNDAIAECKNTGQVPRDGVMLTEVIEGWPAKLIDGGGIPDSYLSSATWFARYIGTKAPPDRLQLLWPDKAGLFPDEVGCVEDVRLAQTPVEVL